MKIFPYNTFSILPELRKFRHNIGVNSYMSNLKLEFKLKSKFKYIFVKSKVRVKANMCTR